MNRICHWLFHSWGNWQVTEHGPWLHDGREVGTYIVQRRFCKVCNKCQLKSEMTIPYL